MRHAEVFCQEILGKLVIEEMGEVGKKVDGALAYIFQGQFHPVSLPEGFLECLQ